MGRAKQQYMRMLEGGWHSVGRKSVCSNCVDDYALKAFVRENGTESRCDYCDENSEDIAAVDSDTLLDFIAEGLRTEYEDPANSVGWCSGEGGWLLPTMDSYDLLEDLGLGNFYDDAALAFSDHDWVERDPYGDRPWESQLSRWSKFCHYVKHERRFFFHGGSERASNGSLVDILDYVGRVATEAEMVTTICRGSSLYRARQHNAALQIQPADVGALATQPVNLSKTSNRMSPAGIPMFYAAMDEETAHLETATHNPDQPVMSIGRFELTRDLHILNLAEIPAVPSIFDSEARHLRPGLTFMRAFADDLSQPIARDGSEHIDYVPTQIVSEFFRLRFSGTPGRIDGLSFRSSKDSHGICVCLFFTHDDFVKKSSVAPLRLLEVNRRRLNMEAP